ncbi:hypothetical protein N7G274_009830 [Stereocaulon virgatum]|uniref:C2H2-type domain-containing protein n=1 Tax=Stereocaulon virgatum TaxID=373712 RepID=A0ABR3ZW08_9LECA
MAKVYSGASDFVRFPREESLYDTFQPQLGEHYNPLQYNPNVVSNMQQAREFSGHTNASYESYPQVSAYSTASSAYFGADSAPFEAHKGSFGHSLQRHTPSGSPSPSGSQIFDNPSSSLSSASGASAQSTASSADGSPYANPQHNLPYQGKWEPFGLGIGPEIVSGESFNFVSDLLLDDGKFAPCVDPSLIQHFDTPISHNTSTDAYPGVSHAFHHPPSQTFQPASPAPSDTSSQDSHRPGSAMFQSGTASPYLHTNSFKPYPQSLEARRLSIASSHSRNSMESPGSTYYGFDDDGKERTRCPHPDCGRPFKDLKAHMLTHQSERPEKCPIVNCAYHHKGFARKYDKNRHTLTHYKGNMVCGFCPGSGSASEKSFNRADVFKRHLTSVHGVEQNPPNSRKKSPNLVNKKTSTQAVDATGKCSTCSATFKNAQELYEHLDDCVLRVVQQEEPSEAINEQHLGGVVNDEAVRETMDRHMLPTETAISQDATNFDDDDEDGNFDDFKDESSEDNQIWPVSSNSRSGKGEITARKGNSS